MNLLTPLVRRACIATTVVLVSSGFAAVAAPAGAVSDPLSYECTSDPDIGSHVFTAVIDTDAPLTLGAGLSVPIKTTSTVTIPDDVADGLRLAAISYVSGSANATGTVDGVNRVTALTIPNTTVPPDGTTMQVVGTGPSGSITAAGAVGSSIVLGAGNFTATLQGYSAAGTPVGSAYTFTCTLQPAPSFVVDSITVVPTPTTTTLTVSTPVEYGAAPEVSADVTVAGSNAKPAGTMEFTFEGKSVKVDVKGGKAKATLSPALTMGSRTIAAKFTPANPSLAASEASKSVTVVKDQTTTTATAVYRDARNRLVGKAKVEAQHGTEVAGDVKFVLKRNGVKIRTAVVELNEFDKAKKVFKRIRKAGTYRLIARYLGSDTLKRSVDRVKLVV